MPQYVVIILEDGDFQGSGYGPISICHVNLVRADNKENATLWAQTKYSDELKWSHQFELDVKEVEEEIVVDSESILRLYLEKIESQIDYTKRSEKQKLIEIDRQIKMLEESKFALL
jgi:hypothetical protein